MSSRDGCGEVGGETAALLMANIVPKTLGDTSLGAMRARRVPRNPNKLRCYAEESEFLKAEFILIALGRGP